MTQWNVYARAALAEKSVDAAGVAVLLEGSWPLESTGNRWALDDAIDASREWIDIESQRLADLAADSHTADAWLNALSLRYYLVKLLRTIVFFTEVCPLQPDDRMRLTVQPGRDDDYAELLRLVCRQRGVELDIARTGHATTDEPGVNRGSRWRNGLHGIAQAVDAWSRVSQSRPRVVLRGNPRLLTPVCRELISRGAQVWWLYDQFAVKSWLKWRVHGVRQLVCQGTAGQAGSGTRIDQVSLASVPLDFQDIDLGPLVGRWLEQRRRVRGARLDGFGSEVRRQFERMRPHAVLLDEDATPMARATVAAARGVEARSLVLQHGAPCCRFGFAPVVADTFLAWGHSSAEQLARWDVPSERVQVIGSPYHESLAARVPISCGGSCTDPNAALGKWVAPAGCDQAAGCGSSDTRQVSPTLRIPRRTNILLLTTVPPRDARPDAIGLNLTRRTYADMIDRAVASVAKIPNARLTIKLHPRCGDDPAVIDALSRHQELDSRIVRHGDLASHIAQSDCVLSCMSSGGVDATLFCLPVIQLLPLGAGDILPADAWGFFGTARNRDELTRLLADALSPDYIARSPWQSNALHVAEQSASERIADVILRKQSHAPIALSPEKEGAVKL